MPESPNAASSPDTGSAGEGDALSRALNSAVETLEIQETDFDAAAMEPHEEAAPDTDAQPDDAPEAKAKPDAKPPLKSDKDKPDPAPSTEIAPPANWDAKRKDAFAKLPTPEARQAMLDMAKGIEGEFTKKSTELADKTRFADSIGSIITDRHREQMRAGGVRSVAEGIAQLVQLHDMAAQNPVGYAQFVVGQMSGGRPITDGLLRQIFPEAFTGQGQAAPQGQPQAHPATPAYEDSPVLNDVRSQLQRQQAWIEEQQQRENQRLAEQQALVSRNAGNATERFRQAVDESGQVKYPYLPRVEARMVELLSLPSYQQITNLDERLEAVYDAATAQDKTIRDEIKQADQRKADDLAKAKRARSPIKSAPVIGTVKQKPNTLDDAVRRAGELLGV